MQKGCWSGKKLYPVGQDLSPAKYYISWYFIINEVIPDLNASTNVAQKVIKMISVPMHFSFYDLSTASSVMLNAGNLTLRSVTAMWCWRKRRKPAMPCPSGDKLIYFPPVGGVWQILYFIIKQYSTIMHKYKIISGWHGHTSSSRGLYVCTLKVICGILELHCPA